jgi:type VI protein secretion system component VasK
MITIAAVTMFFLPGTFISAILSTTFFDYGEEKLSVSKAWWVLPASTIPTTIGVFAVWLAWRWWRLKKQEDEIKHGDKDVEQKAEKKQ